jgi:hypothetical protein
MGSGGRRLLAKNGVFAGISPGSTRLSTGVESASRKGDTAREKPPLCSPFPATMCPQQTCGELVRKTSSILAIRGCPAAVLVPDGQEKRAFS